jgi:hypothetical protein
LLLGLAIFTGMTTDRKELLHQYKTTPRTMGVAVIRHTASGKAFVFANLDINALVNRYRTQLKFGGHANKDLQRDWQEFGEGAFAVEILDTMVPKDDPEVKPEDELRLLEELWLEKLNPYVPNGYNRAPKAR